jgi:hypothetical protein
MSKVSKKKKITRNKNNYKRKNKKIKKTLRKKRLKYKRITKLGKKWIKQMEIFMLLVQG